MLDPGSLPQDLEQLREQWLAGRRSFQGLELVDTDFADLNLGGADLRGSCFRASRFGHGQLNAVNLSGAFLQEALLWGADLSDCIAEASFWQEADLSGARLQRANFRAAYLHRACLRGVIAPNSCWQEARLIE
ncbi:MAG: pentapeptide repeat-containing protein, partial [Synechococcaceae bacterium WB6_1A_059]|nr:pentapeptide repeat-containing protein [Synechococcaceae bacterium WB6_1A_059]